MKKIEGFLTPGDKLGNMTGTDGHVIAEDPHPGPEHHEIQIGGLVGGDSRIIKFIVAPNSNEPQYFMKYDFNNKKFTKLTLELDEKCLGCPVRRRDSDAIDSENRGRSI